MDIPRDLTNELEKVVSFRWMAQNISLMRLNCRHTKKLLFEREKRIFGLKIDNSNSPASFDIQRHEHSFFKFIFPEWLPTNFNKLLSTKSRFIEKNISSCRMLSYYKMRLKWLCWISKLDLYCLMYVCMCASERASVLVK